MSHGCAYIDLAIMSKTNVDLSKSIYWELTMPCF